ncbi:MAG: sugar ABC transporter substrate-binding protein [Spirochaetaceae bacterium 4572_59]|nr:MAG: sugar ABC transporter substrate-binding protein [Spirochaetaceae bacterium 4572_59]
MKKIFLVCLMPLLIFSAFAAGQQETGEKKVTLTVAGRDGSYGDSMQLAADSYSAQNPSVDFELLKLSGSSLFEKSVIDMKSGLGSYDVILVDDPNITQFQKVGWLANLSDMFKNSGKSVDSGFIGSVLKLGKYPYTNDGPLFALPFAGNVELFAYRTDLFEKYNLEAPDTWDQVLTAVKTIDENEADVNGVVFRGSKGNPIVTGFLPIFWSYGAKILDDNGNVTVNSPEALNALNYFLKLAKYAPEGVSMYQSAQVKDAIYSGKAAVVTEVWPGWINKLEDPTESAVVGKVKVIKHPGQVEKSSPMIGVWMIAIPEASKNKEAAFDFINFATSEATQDDMAKQFGNPPTRGVVYGRAELTKKYPWYPAQLDALNNGVARTRTTKWKEIEAQMGTALQFALIGERTAEEALADAEKGIIEVLK